MADQPISLFRWTEGQPDQVQQPPTSLQATGYSAGQAPAAEHINWIFWQIRNTLDYLLAANGSTVMQTTLDASTRLVGGGTWSYNSATRVLSWSAAANLAVPTLPLSANRLAAGSVTIASGSVVVVQANVPITLTGQIRAGAATVSNVSAAINIPVGAAVSGAGIADGTTVTSIDQNTITLSANATANNDTAALTFITQGDLTPAVYDIGTLKPNANTVVIAFGMNDYAAIGVNSVQMSLRNGEAKTLMGLTGYTGMVCANAGVALSARQALYVSNGSNDGRTASQVYPADASAANGATRAQFIGFASHDVAAGDCAALVSMGTMTGFSGLSPGSVYYLDPSTPGGIIASRTTTVGQYAVPVGFAIDNGSLRINPEATRNLQAVSIDSNIAGNLSVGGTASIAGAATTGAITSSGIVTAQKFVSQVGFPVPVCMGSATLSGSSTSAQFSFAGGLRYYTAEYAGSVLALRVNAPSYVHGNFTITLIQILADGTYKTAAQISATPFTTSKRTPTLSLTFAKGSLSFVAGDQFYINAGCDTTQGNTTVLLGDLTIEQGQ